MERRAEEDLRDYYVYEAAAQDGLICGDRRVSCWKCERCYCNKCVDNQEVELCDDCRQGDCIFCTECCECGQSEEDEEEKGDEGHKEAAGTRRGDAAASGGGCATTKHETEAAQELSDSCVFYEEASEDRLTCGGRRASCWHCGRCFCGACCDSQADQVKLCGDCYHGDPEEGTDFMACTECCDCRGRQEQSDEEHHEDQEATEAGDRSGDAAAKVEMEAAEPQQAKEEEASAAAAVPTPAKKARRA